MRILLISIVLVSCSMLCADDSLSPAVPAKVMRYAGVVIQRYDKDGNGSLQQTEWNSMPGKPQAMDIDGDQQVTKEELVWYFAQFGRTRTIHRTIAVDLREPYKFDPVNLKLLNPVMKRPAAEKPETVTQEPPKDLTEEQITANEQPIDENAYQKMLEERQIPAERPYHVLPEKLRGVPRWFILQDKNGDGQISMTEFVPTLLPAMVNRFKQLDKNSDGLIEPDEVR